MLTPAAVSEVRRAVRAALCLETGDGSPAWTWHGRVPGAAFVAAVERHRVAPLLTGHAGALDLPAAIADEVRALRDAERLGALAQIRLSAEVDALLAGIDHLFLKGVVLAATTTGDPAARGAGDVDVLVPPERLGDAVTALSGAGWAARPTYTADQRSWAWRYQRWGAHEMAFDRGAETVDLHWRLDPTYDGLPPFAQVWERRERVTVGPLELDTLGVPDAFAHTLRHAARDGWETLRSLVDVHRLAGHSELRESPVDAVGAATLSAVDAAIGLPSTAPPFTRTATPLPRLVSAQRRPLRHAWAPGQRTVREAGYRWRSSHSPRDLAITAATLVLPPASTAPIAEPTAARALVAAATHRLGQVGWKVSGWRTEL